jgi:TonB-linked SusC/RagA family outer membrane protein
MVKYLINIYEMQFRISKMKKIDYIKLICLWLLAQSITYTGFAQQQLIRGTIIDEAGKPVPNATIMMKGAAETKVYSDSTGTFTLTGEIGHQIEVISGPRHKTYLVESTPVVLSITDKDTYVPTGYGMQLDKTEVTAAIGMVSGDQLKRGTAINPANALYGTIPGLTVLQNGGTSWEDNPDMFIRGVGTFRDRSLHVLIDGFERPLSSISLGEIESVAIYKDAAALARFGVSGANGVLMVTTKRADPQKDKIQVEYEFGLKQPTELPDFLDAYGYAQAVNEALILDGQSPRYDQTALSSFQSGNSPYLYPNVNWVDQTFRDFGTVQNIKIAFQNTTKRINYYTYLNYQTDQGLLDHTDMNEGYSTQLTYNNFNFRSNMDIEVTNTTDLRVNVGGNIRDTRTPGTSVADIMWAVYTTPPAAYPIKTYNNRWGGTSYYNNNPVAQVSSTGYRKSYTRELLADFTLEQELDFLLPGLSAEAALAYDNSAVYMEGKTKQYEYEQLNKGEGGSIIETRYGEDTELGYYSYLGGQWYNTTVRGKLQYDTYWDNQVVNATLIYEQFKTARSGQNNTFLHQNMGGLLHYSKDMKYFADLSLMYSGTNRLPEGNRFNLFPAISFAWLMSEEDWFADNGLVDDLKLRASFGMAGNDLAIPFNLNAEKYHGGAGYYYNPNNGSVGGIIEGNLPTINPRPEISHKFNLGVDVSMLNNLNLTADVFYDHRTNILFEPQGSISNVLGAWKPLLTEGIVNNMGGEFGINWSENVGDFTYYVNGLFSFVKNEIVEMGEQYRPFDYLKQTGQSIGQAFGFEAIGFFKDENDINSSPRQMFSEVKPGDIKYKDQNGDGFIDDYDAVPMGYNTLNPEIYYAASLGLEYKGFGVDAQLQGIANYTVYMDTPGIFWPLRNETSITSFSGDRWTPSTSESASLPRLTTSENENNFRPNSIWLKDGSYLKLRYLEVYYNLPKKLISGLNLSSASLFLRGTDLFSIDHIDMVDSEAIGLTYPICASYSIGMKIGF